MEVSDGNDNDGSATCEPLAALENNPTCVHLRGEENLFSGVHLIRLVD